jgi:predicted dehydrogenase
VWRVKVYGAGSIGNHLTNAARRKGWHVVVCDVDPKALERMRGEIYPGRYGAWDDDIELFENVHAPKGGFDLICIGTPPQWHLPLALEALDETPRALLIEKPVCPPTLEHAAEMWVRSQAGPTRVFVGYDHVVAKGIRAVEEIMRSGAIGTPKTLDVEFREHWAGIFKAHPWLSGPQDTYLGYWEAGGGASGEHSHAINLWQHLAHVAGAGRVAALDARLGYVRAGRAWYDELCLLNLVTEAGFAGRVVQDVVTLPSRKWARVQGSEGAVEWTNHGPSLDTVRLLRPGQADDVQSIAKTRPDDFVEELTHIERYVAAGEDAGPSPISLERGLDTMLVIAGAHAAAARQASVAIDYAAGYPATVNGRARMGGRR